MRGCVGGGLGVPQCAADGPDGVAAPRGHEAPSVSGPRFGAVRCRHPRPVGPRGVRVGAECDVVIARGSSIVCSPSMSHSCWPCVAVVRGRPAPRSRAPATARCPNRPCRPCRPCRPRRACRRRGPACRRSTAACAGPAGPRARVEPPSGVRGLPSFVTAVFLAPAGRGARVPQRRQPTLQPSQFSPSPF